MASALSDDIAEIGLGVVIIINQLLVALCLFNRIEIGPLDVFDDRQFKSLLVINITNDDGNLVEGCSLGSPPTAFTGNDFLPGTAGIFTLDRTNQNWLDNSVLGNRPREISQMLLNKIPPRIVCIGADMFNWHLAVGT